MKQAVRVRPPGGGAASWHHAGWRWRALLAASLGALGFGLAHGAQPAGSRADDIAAGERLYRDGLHADGRPLVAERLQGLSVRGREAACTQCHRPSGMGGAEGSLAVPPIVGAVLRAPGQATTNRPARVAPGLQRLAPASQTRPAYTADSLARALTLGIGPGGQPLDALMPRYRLGEADLRQLGAYLDTLQIGHAPGLADGVLHLATIVSADTPLAVQQASTELLEDCLRTQAPPRPTPGGSTEAAEAPPTWALHRWMLGAEPARWPQELADWQRRQPVFALISGVTGGDGRGAWQPVHQHCERSSLPCVLPHTMSVDDQRPSHWSLYYTRGVSLEASAMAEHLAEGGARAGWQQVHQIVQPGHEAAATGARALQRQLSTAGLPGSVRSPLEVTDAWLATLGSRDALVLWLDAAALRSLTSRHALPATGTLLFSGDLVGLEAQALALPWRRTALMTHAYEPASRHLPRLALNAGRWLAARGHPLAVDPQLLRLQAHTYSACAMTANALRRMGSRVGREYFLELLEGADEAAVATAFPRFTLGPGQRHGSQGIGLMRYAGPAHEQLQPVGEWLTPP